MYRKMFVLFKYFATIHRVYFSEPLNTKISISSEYLIIRLDSKTFNSSIIHSWFCKVHITRIVHKNCSCKIFIYNRGYDKAELSNEIIPVEFGEVKQDKVDENHR